MRQHRGWVTFLLWKGRKAHERERNTNGKKKKAGILQTFPSANLIFLDEAVYSRCTQSPLPQEENMPKAKSWNIALHRGERERERPQSKCTDHFHSVSHPQPSKPSDALLCRAPVGLTLLWADGRGRLSTCSRPAKPQWLPASVPAGVCSCLHDDLEPVLFSGAWHSECSRRRMQRSHTTDALLSAGCSAPPWCSLRACQTMMRVPLVRFFCCFFRLIYAGYTHFCDNLSPLSPWLVTYFSLLFFFLKVRAPVCVWLAASVSIPQLDMN